MTLTPQQFRERPIAEQIARTLDPQAWSQADHAVDEAVINELTAKSVQMAAALRPCLEALGLYFQPAANLGEALERSLKMIEGARDTLKPHKDAARGDLNDILYNLGELFDEVTDLQPEIACSECGDYSADGEGYDGLCGNCADRASDDEGEAINVADITEFEIDEQNDDIRYGAYYVRSREEYRGVVYTFGGQIQRTTEDLHDLAEDAIAAARELVSETAQ